MLHRAGKKQQKQVEYESGSDEDMGSDLSGDELQTREPVGEDADIGAENDLIEHVKVENFKGAQSIFIDIEIPASPEEMESGAVSTVWKMADHLPKFLKQNVATKDRHLAGDDDLVGDLHLCVPLELEILQQKNSQPFTMGVRSRHMMNRTINQHGAYLWTVPPDTPTSAVNQLAFEPTNPVTKNAYLNSTMYTMANLNADIKLFEKEGKQEAYGTIAVKSLAYTELIKNLELGRWSEEDLNLEAIEDAPVNRVRTVEVPYKVASQLKERLAQPTLDIIKRCMNLEDFTFEVVRADGQTAFNSPMNLHGELCGSEVDADHKIRSEKLLQRGMYHIKAKFTYFLLDESQYPQKK